MNQACWTEGEDEDSYTEILPPGHDGAQYDSRTFGTTATSSATESQLYSAAKPVTTEEVKDRNMDQNIAEAAAKLCITEEDSVIAVMGLTGTGKSTFINYLTADAEAGHKLKSFTKHVSIHTFQHRDGRSIYLVDTPGFNDTVLSDIQVLEKVACFLSATYSSRIKLVGIIYLHRITDRRMEHSSLDNLDMFKKLCGTACLKNVILATTMWDDLRDQEVGDIRETELKTDPEFWGDMVDLGSTVMRQDRGKTSGLEIVDHILDLRGPRVVTRIAVEMIDDKKRLRDTGAGEESRKQLIAADKKHQEQLKRVQASHQAAIEAGNLAAAEKLKAKEDKLRDMQKSHKNDMKILEETFEQTQKRNNEENKRLIAELQEKNRKESEKAQREINAKLREVKDLEIKLKTLDKDIASVKAKGVADVAKSEEDRREHMANMRRMQEQFRHDIEQAKEEARAQERARSSPAAWLAAAGGVLTTIGGVVTFNPPLAAAGIALATGAAAKAANS